MPFIAIVIYIVLMGSIFIFRLLPEEQMETFNDSVITVVCLVGSIQLFRITRLFQPGDEVRKSWMLFAIGLSCEAIGHLWYSVQGFVYGEVFTFPNTADVFIMAGAVCYVISFWNFSQQVKKNALLNVGSLAWVVNGIFLALVALNVIFIVRPILMDTSESLWMRFLYLYYPVFDTFLAFFCLHLALSFLQLGQSPIAKPWAILVGSFLIFLVTDSTYAYFDVIDAYHPYLLINPGWGLAYLGVSHAAYVQEKVIRATHSIQVSDDFWSHYEDDGKGVF
jgi:hypothetical protein